jgi:hypothetical protein
MCNISDSFCNDLYLGKKYESLGGVEQENRFTPDKLASQLDDSPAFTRTSKIVYIQILKLQHKNLEDGPVLY